MILETKCESCSGSGKKGKERCYDCNGIGTIATVNGRQLLTFFEKRLKKGGGTDLSDVVFGLDMREVRGF